jgi:hypothetical protein
VTRLRSALGCCCASLLALCAAAATPGRSFVQNIEGVDISGTWVVEGYIPSARPTQEKMMKPLDGGPVPLQPWAEKIYRERLSKDKTADAFMNSAAYCLPLGMPSMMLGATYPFSILQTPGQVTTVHEEGHVHRQIFLNRAHDPDPDPGYLGESVGRWEGDTLVVDTIGLNDKTSLDLLGIPHSDALHVVERIRRIAPDRLENVMTFEDPKAFTRPWRFRRTYALQKPGVHPAEYFCQDGQMNTPDPVTGRPTYPTGAAP